MAEAHLLLVTDRAGALEALVAAGARQGAVAPHEIALAAKFGQSKQQVKRQTNK